MSARPVDALSLPPLDVVRSPANAMINLEESPDNEKDQSQNAPVLDRRWFPCPLKLPCGAIARPSAILIARLPGVINAQVDCNFCTHRAGTHRPVTSGLYEGREFRYHKPLDMLPLWLHFNAGLPICQEQLTRFMAPACAAGFLAPERMGMPRRTFFSFHYTPDVWRAWNCLQNSWVKVGARGRTVTLKVKFNDFEIYHCCSRSVPVSVSSRRDLELLATGLSASERNAC